MAFGFWRFLWGTPQAAIAGSELKKLVGDESVYFIVSPYTRTRMTYEIVREKLGQRHFFMKEDPRLRGEGTCMYLEGRRGRLRTYFVGRFENNPRMPFVV